jgi:hypothetical protein
MICKHCGGTMAFKKSYTVTPWNESHPCRILYDLFVCEGCTKQQSVKVTEAEAFRRRTA